MTQLVLPCLLWPPGSSLAAAGQAWVLVDQRYVECPRVQSLLVGAALVPIARSQIPEMRQGVAPGVFSC